MGDPTRTVVSITHADAAENRDAALAICARARDKADAVLLLTACGLIPDTREA